MNRGPAIQSFTFIHRDSFFPGNIDKHRDKTMIARNLKWLEGRGLIVPTGAEDGREHRFMLTAEGRKRLAGAKPRWKKAQDHLRSGMTGQQWDTMFDAFRAVARAARTAHRSLDIKDPTRRSSTIP